MSEPNLMERARKDFLFESKELLEKAEYELGADRPLIFRCFDSRLDAVFDAFLAANGWSHKDVISIPGGALSLASNRPDDAEKKKILLGWVQDSIRLHSAKWAMFTIHFDCGGYKKDGTPEFVNDEAEIKRQMLDIVEAVRCAGANLPAGMFLDGRYIDGHGIHPVG